jgi:hypothetical protein
MAAFGKPLWVTEVSACNGSYVNPHMLAKAFQQIGCVEYGATTYFCNEAETTAFMKQVMSDMDDPANNVERYSWFGAFPNMASG